MGTPYRVISWLGEGGMGIVYEAEHLDLGRHVALKLLHPHLCVDSNQAENFRSEARMMTKVACDQIVQVYDFTTLEDGRLLYVMELLEGKTISFHAGKQMDIGRFVGIMRQACKGLYAAHSEGIVHRDIKPENLFILDNAEITDTLKIMDFGIAQMLALASGGSELAGTPLYMAPEQIRRQACDARTDIYGLGCTGYELLFGRAPFPGTDVKNVLRQHLKTEVSFPKEPSYPTPLLDILRRCLAKNPDERWPDMLELEAALCEVQIASGFTTAWDHLPVPAIDPDRRAAIIANMPDPERDFADLQGKNHRRLLSAAAIALGLMATAVWSQTQASSEDQRVEQLTRDAHDAAAKANFVYPPPGNPEAITAYRSVVALEDLDERNANEASQVLRQEFGQTLRGLGDRYWDAPGGKGFAVDYYAQAIIFDSSLETATHRARISLGQLTVLRDRASSGSFEEEELLAVEPLQVLAMEMDATRRHAALSTLLAKRSDLSPRTSHQLTTLMRGSSSRMTPSPSLSHQLEIAAQGPDATPSAGLSKSTTEKKSRPPSATSLSKAKKRSRPSNDLGEKAASKREASKARKRVSRGRKAIKATRWALARTLLHQALEADSRSHAALIALSDLSFEQDNIPDAARYARRAVQLAPRNARYRMLLGDIYFRLSRYSDARTEYTTARKLGHRKAESGLKRLERILGP